MRSPCWAAHPFADARVSGAVRFPFSPGKRPDLWGTCSSIHLANVPLIDIGIPQKGNGRHDVKGKVWIRPLSHVLVLANSHHWGMLTASLELYVAQLRRKSSHGRES